ncbi:hypothetical protein PVL29_008686 [Vitis rotundifolia]|uniref:Uncharacterized protein n=2 Tax=Vitis rotundifolia TaxID=103349 RepID=A0AA38ZWI5_VITRO|nr:hypothetical protein PVL29_008686 [Vitis rotundifolia]
MDDDSWSFGFSTSTKSYRSALMSRRDLCIDFDDLEGDDDSKVEFPCPFCSEDFDIVGLCCHIDEEHPTESNYGICTVCGTRVGIDMIEHLTTQHGNIFKLQQKLKLHKGESHSLRSWLKKELQDGQLQSLLRGSSVFSSSNTEPDPLLSSFIYNMPMVDVSESMQPSSSTEVNFEKKSLDENMLERNMQLSPLSDKDQKEKAKQCEFVQGLLLSTFLDDNL